MDRPLTTKNYWQKTDQNIWINQLWNIDIHGQNIKTVDIIKKPVKSLKNGKIYGPEGICWAVEKGSKNII